MLRFDSLLFRTLATAALVIMIIAALSLAETVFVPLFIAFFIAILLHLPLVAMQKRGIPRPLGAGILVLIILGGVIVFATLVVEPARTLANEYPQMLQELRVKIFRLQISMSEAQDVGKAVAEVTEEVSKAMQDGPAQEVIVQDDNFMMRAVSSIVGGVSSILITLTICGFILSIRRPFLVFATIPYARQSEKLHAARIWKEIEAHVSQYFFITTAINIGLGVIVGFALYLVEMPMPAFWGAVVAFLNYMPFIGPAIGAVLIFAVSIISFDTFSAMFIPPAIYLAINFIEANFVTPHLVGKRTNISPLAIIISLLFWGWLWGFVGFFISVPMLVILNAMAQHADSLSILRRTLTPRAVHAK